MYKYILGMMTKSFSLYSYNINYMILSAYIAHKKGKFNKS